MINYYVNADVLARLQVVLDQCAFLVIGDSTLTPDSSTGVLGTIALNGTPWTYAGRTATLNSPPLTATATATGTAALAELRDSGGDTRINNITVGTSDADIIIDNATVTLGNTLTVTAGTVTG